MANTFELISSYTVSTPVASIEFTSIPSTYTDLCVKYSLRGVSASTVYTRLQFNSSSSNLSSRNVNGSGSAANSYTYGTEIKNIAGQVDYTWTANTFSNGEYYIPNYAGSANKSVSIDAVTENNATAAYSALTAGLWSNTAAITSIKILAGETSDTFATYSTAYLYGVKNA